MLRTTEVVCSLFFGLTARSAVEAHPRSIAHQRHQNGVHQSAILPSGHDSGEHVGQAQGKQFACSGCGRR